MGDILVPETISIPKACQLISVSRRTIYNWIKAGKIEYLRTPGGVMRITTASLFRDGNVKWRRA